MLERKSWNVPEDQLAEELVRLVKITSTECQLLKSLQPVAQKVSLELVEEYYDQLMQHEETREYITNLQGLKETLARWFIELFCGNYDKAYTLNRLRIGKVHVRIGLPVRYPLAMFSVLSRYGERVASAKGEHAKEAFRKVLALDVATFTQSYDNTQLSHLSNLIGGSERLARRLLADEY